MGEGTRRGAGSPGGMTSRIRDIFGARERLWREGGSGGREEGREEGSGGSGGGGGREDVWLTDAGKGVRERVHACSSLDCTRHSEKF